MFLYETADTSDMAIKHAQLEELAEDLTRVLSIPFKATSRGTITFRDPLRVTDWSVPLLFDGHCRLDGGGLVPATFAGHVLWAALRSSKKADESRAWWTCTLTTTAAAAIVESVEVEELEGWSIGTDILLEDVEDDQALATVSPIRIAS
ncbi:MAG: hypothetical protein QOE93_2281 [Actinomycetota bacterium]|jgi:hypothetical protein|nr:hypothetical protein [Actinomycetota bacterium]